MVNGFDRPGVSTNVGGGADPHETQNHFHVEVTPAQQQLFQQHAEPVTPKVGIALAAGGTEGAEVLFMLSADPAPSEPLEVALTVSQEGDHVVAAALGRRTVTVPVSGSVTVSIPTVDDEVEEEDGTVTASLAAGSGYTLGLLSTMAVEVVDNDEVAPVLTSTALAEPVAVSLSAERSAIAEAKGKTKFRIELSRALVAGEVVRVPFTMSGGRKGRHWKVHFREADNGPGVKRTATGKKSAVRFSKGGRVATLVLVALPNKDTVARTISIGFGEGQRTPSSAGVAGGIVLMGEPLAVAIIDDDRVVPTVTVSAGDGVPEGDGASFSLRADPAPVSDLAVTVSIGSSGGAVAPSGQGERTVTLPKGEREGSFTVATVDDGADSAGGSVTATVVAQEGYTLDGEGTVATVVVKDDDATVVRLSAPAGDVDEAGGAKVLTVALDRGLVAGESLSVPLVLGGVARLGSDYTLSAPETLPQGVSYAHLGGSEGSSQPTLTFSGPSSAAATVHFTATEDTAAEGASETVTVGLGTLTATGLDGGASAAGGVGFAILEPPPQVAVVAKSAAVTEGGTAVFTVTASRVAESDLTVHLVVSEAGDGDFVAAEQEGAASVTLPKGEREGSFTVSTVDDGVDEPDGTVSVTLAVDGEEGQRYTVAAAPKDAASVAVSDNDAAATVPMLSVEDATAHENEGLIWFTVRLSEELEQWVWVSYRTQPVTAQEDQDYVGSSDRLSFQPKQREQRFAVILKNDSHDEGRETFEVVLSGAKGAVIGDGVAVGAIVNDDPLPAAWLVRFGRTVSHQVVDALQQRFTAPPSASGLHLSVAGEELTGAAPLVENRQVLSKVLGFETVTAQHLVEGSSFSFSPHLAAGEQGEGEGGGGRFSLWGQGALASFSGAEDSVSLEGEVGTALVGAEWSSTRWQAGAALSHSWGSGSYQGQGHHREGEAGHPGHPGHPSGDGRISSSLSGIFPYGRYALTPRLGVWGVAGAGRGQLSLKPDGDGREYQPDINLGMAAVGLDGLLLDGGAAGLRLTTTTDLLTVSTTSAAVEEGLKASDGTVSRLRLGLEAARPFPLSNGASLLPSLEVGIRQDSGDAETGFGLELGAGLAWRDPARGIGAELRGRSLLSHADEEFQEQGLAVSLAWDPTPSNRGPSFSLNHVVGAVVEGGMDALLHPVVLEGLAARSSEGQQQFETRFAYGFPIFSDQLTLSPALELALSPTSRTYGLLWTVAPHDQQQRQPLPWHLSLEGERQEHAAAASPTDHSLGLRFSLLF
ncbi:MAG: hypothetical protein OXH01_11340 [Bacteroidetes bacterium]|nr:hypothetical protein [Bacteroidota bacterium]